MLSRPFHARGWETLRRCARRFSDSKSITLIIFCAALLFSATYCNGQDVTGRITGTVTDPSGAAIPGAKVSVVNEATKAIRQLTADQNGYFVADELPAGTYTVTGENTGFKTTSRTGNVVTAGGRLTVDLALQIGAATETVFVNAVGDTVNTTSGEISTTVTEQQVQNLALNQRHYETLMSLIPGASLQSSGTNPASLTTGFSTTIANVNGQRLDGQNWSVDGGFNLDSGSNNSEVNQVGADFIQEVDIQSSNYDAEFGRSDSSTINVVTKSGGEQFHGEGFEYVQNNMFNAENPGTKLTTPTATGYNAVPPFHFNDFGWNLGGPIPRIQPKGKLFFFAGQEWKKFRGVYPGLASASAQETFPTAAEATGDFTDVYNGGAGLVMKTPAVIPASCSGGVLYTAPNVINPTCITGDGAAMANLYASAAKLSTGGGLPTFAGSNNATFNLPTPLDIREDIVRVDEHLNDKQSIYFRYLHDSVNIYAPLGTFPSFSNAVPVDPDVRHRPGFNLQLSWTDVIRPNLVNEAKINADWHSQRIPPTGTSYLKTPYGFSFIPPFGNPGQFPDGLPSIQFTAVNKFPTSGPASVNGPAPDFLIAPATDINPVDNFSWTKHNHAFKFGAEFVRNRKTQNSRTNYDGLLKFDTNAGATTGSNSTGDPFADALLGNFDSLSQNSAMTIGQFRFNDFEAYGQDTWRVTRQLSLVAGLRYIRTTPTYTQGNNMTNFNPYAFNPALVPTFTGGNSSSTINPASPGLCSGPLTTVVGSPILYVECNGLQLPGQVPSDQARSVPVTSADPVLLAAFNKGAARGFYQQENLFAPRFGFSFAPFPNNKTVIRGGFGVFYDKPQGNLLGLGINSQGYAPWAQQVSISGGNTSLSQYDSAPGSVVLTPSTISLNGVDPNLVVARSYQYSFGVQRELPESMLVQISYVGNLGRHILRAPGFNNAQWTQQGYIPVTPNPNNLACPAGIDATAYQCSGGFAPSNLSKDQVRPYLGYSSIQMALSDGNSNYNALQANLTKRAGFLTATVAYTYSKAMGDDSGVGSAYNENGEPECVFTCLVSTASNPVLVNGLRTAAAGGTQTGGVVESWQKYYYGKVSFDATHIIATTFTLESPFGKHMTGFEGGVVKGWMLSAIMHFQTGSPLTATASVNAGLNGSSITRRAAIVPGQSLYDKGGLCDKGLHLCWANPAAFATESALGAGDAPSGDVIGPNYYNWDLSLRKSFALPFREGASLQFQADAFNAFNRANWSNPSLSNAAVGSTSFGQISGSNPARVLQFGGKISF